MNILSFIARGLLALVIAYLALCAWVVVAFFCSTVWLLPAFVAIWALAIAANAALSLAFSR